ncbi:MAG: DNA-deoxyinosine glycosylase [Synergistaceae bacterium]|jgi:TDG/mug DNA glycosylase family protein|nr:DNA-deoxyinosine glycosylase [Synergistaceae bacterium]
MNRTRINSFEPLVGEAPLLLILGSVPGVASLKSGRYYGHERNHFWRLMSAVLEEPEHPDYEERVAMLKRHRVALWDSVGSCVRPGSLDKDIREERPNDIPALLRDHPTIRAICFNGRASRAVYCRHHAERMKDQPVQYLLLPSSSPIPRKFVKTFEDRLVTWMEIRRVLNAPDTDSNSGIPKGLQPFSGV